MSSWYRAENKDDLELFYKSVLLRIKEAALACGYAIGVHGSMRRDLDLIAVPWVDNHASKDDLAMAIQKSACGFVMKSYAWEQKPFLRMATAFPICTINHHNFDEKELSLGHVDLSVIEFSKDKAHE